VIWSSRKISKVRYNEVISISRLLDDNVAISDIMDELPNTQNGIPRNPFRFNRRRSSRLASNNFEQSIRCDSAEENAQNSFNADEDTDWETMSEESSDEYSESTDDEDGQIVFNIPFPDIEKPSKIGYKKANEVSNYILDDELIKQPMRKESKESSVNDALRVLFLSKVDSRLKIPKFDIVKSDTQRKEDHAFINEYEEAELDQEFLKVMHAEWQRLLNELPDGIFVRTYESRIDLMRAVILGSPHTPYHNGVFVFDILLHPSYPDDPPSVHFISYSENLNPNLAEDGEVSLNLLDSWHEADSEGWDPDNSNILQLLISIKESVLDISEPYFNEEGYKKQIGTREGIHKSRFYNENALLLSVNHMLNTLSNPPMYTEQIVARHFQEKKNEICEELEAYLDDKDIVLKLFEYDMNGLKVNPSKGFKLRLQKLFPPLKAKLEEKVEVIQNEQANCRIS
jgi:ubiquitin-protein ligase